MLVNTKRVLAVSSIKAEVYIIRLAIEASRSGSPSMCLACDRLGYNITLAYVGQLSQPDGAATFADKIGSFLVTRFLCPLIEY